MRIFPAKNVPRQFSMLHGNRIEIRAATVGVIFEQIKQAESTLMPWHKKHMQCGNGLRSAHTRAKRGEAKRRGRFRVVRTLERRGGSI